MNHLKSRVLSGGLLLALALVACAQTQNPGSSQPAAIPAAPVPASAPMATAGLPDFTGIVQRNAPAVVYIEAKTSGKQRRAGNQPQLPDLGPNDPAEELFRRFFGMPMPRQQDPQRTSAGSGFIISADGYIITNTHVVDGTDEVSVRLQDRRTFSAKVVGADSQYDIALLKIHTGSSLPAVAIGDSHNLKPGQWVLAIGAPFGFDYSVTQGIVSAIGRNLGAGDQPYTSFIQTDVPINRGNSGGPLFDLSGRVVGVNSQIYSNTGNYVGVAFSIPIDVAMNAVQQIKDKGFVSRGQLGVVVEPLSDEMVKALKLATSNGAIVNQVQPGSAADKAGLRVGDIVLGYNGTTINQASDLPPLVGMTKPGTRATVDILRDGKRQSVSVTVGEAPRDRQAILASDTSIPEKGGASALGLKVESMREADRQQFGLKPGEGVLISQASGIAAQVGLQPGDAVLMVGQKRIGSVADFESATKGVRAGDNVLLLVRHGNQQRFLALTVPDRRAEQ